MNGVFEVLGLQLKLVIAGAVGAFVSLKFFDGLTPGERWVTFLGGWGLASFGSTPLFQFFGLGHPSIEQGIALLLGLFGMSVAAAAIKVIRETDWSNLIKLRARAKKDDEQ